MLVGVGGDTGVPGCDSCGSPVGRAGVVCSVGMAAFLGVSYSPGRGPVEPCNGSSGIKPSHVCFPAAERPSHLPEASVRCTCRIVLTPPWPVRRLNPRWACPLRVAEGNRLSPGLPSAVRGGIAAIDREVAAAVCRTPARLLWLRPLDCEHSRWFGPLLVTRVGTVLPEHKAELPFRTVAARSWYQTAGLMSRGPPG